MFFDANQVRAAVDEYSMQPRALRAAERILLLAVLIGFILGRK